MEALGGTTTPEDVGTQPELTNPEGIIRWRHELRRRWGSTVSIDGACGRVVCVAMGRTQGGMDIGVFGKGRGDETDVSSGSDGEYEQGGGLLFREKQMSSAGRQSVGVRGGDVDGGAEGGELPSDGTLAATRQRVG